ncbi:MAG: VCBS repeat-containing protein, partial [Verrucomicrobia bacterium]|nr:VCBS repeat-containing protein [Verrucomicrobiota bacterium]
LSGDEALRVFAAGSAARLTVEAIWPSGRRTVVPDVPANSRVELVEDDRATPVPPPPAPSPVLFSDESQRLAHESTTTPFNDFERQPLLPWSLAYPGPGATWADLDGDGRDDLVLGANAGGVPAVFLNGASGFVRQTNAPLWRPVARDLTTILVGGGTLVAGSSNYRDGRTNGGALRLMDLDRNAAGDSVLGPDFAVGPLAQADVDGDGTLELFVGGRAIAGRYPEAAPSLLLRMEGGRFVVAQRWEAFGLVTSAVFADGDADGDADLLVATEWGPLRFLRNDGGRLQPVDLPVRAPEGIPGITRLSDLTGWWTSLSVGDLDGDGRLDFLAGNRGWNWFPVPKAPDSNSRMGQDLRSVTYADFDGNGVVDLIESYRVGDRELHLRRADVLMAVLPQLRDVFPTRAAFGAATLSQVLAALPVASPLARREARWFATTVFLNRGDHLEVVPLPVEAQMSPVTGSALLDADGDGRLDVVLAQNFYPGRPDESRQDAGKGLLLRGDGHGGFRAVPAGDSGLNVWGDARALAVADHDRDGRADLVATQNSGVTKLYRNAGAAVGIRVTLAGPPGNPYAVGASLRLVTAAGHGPAQAVVSGSGWLSVDSPSRVLTAPAAPIAVEVRWPGGKTTRSELRPGMRDVRIASDALLQEMP